MASIYSRSHHNMSLSKEFPGGITNGAFWYGKFKTVSYAQELLWHKSFFKSIYLHLYKFCFSFPLFVAQRLY
jgi:hypothetical protein